MQTTPTTPATSALDLYLTPGLFTRLAQLGLATALVTITILALIPPEQVPLATLGDKVLHMSAFITLAMLSDAAFPGSHWNWRKFSLLMGYGFIYRNSPKLSSVAYLRSR